MKKLLGIVSMVMMSVMLVTGCQSSTPDDGAAPAQGNSEEGTMIESDNEDGIVFRYGTKEAYPNSKNPWTSTWAICSTVYNNRIYEGLLDQGLDLEIRGILAETWEVSEDGLTWTFYLREGVKWHDGEEFTADDVVFSYDTILASQAPRVYAETQDVVETKKIDDYTVQVTTAAPKADIINLGLVPIVPKHIWETAGDILDFDNENPIGTGAWKYKDERVDEFVRLEAFDDYWDGRPKIDELLFVFFANEDTALQSLEAGEIDMMQLNASQVDYAAGVEGIGLNRFSSLSFTQLGFNMWQDEASKGNPLIRDVKEIRQAIDYAIDYESILEYAEGGVANEQKGLIPTPSTPWSWSPDASQLRSHSEEKAIELLESVGFTNIDSDGIRSNDAGEKLLFRMSIIENSYRDHALIIERNLKNIGIGLDITYVESSRQREIIYDNDFDTDMFIWGWTGDFEDPGYILSVVTTEQIGLRSDCFYSNADYDALYELQSTMVDVAERTEVVHEMQEIVYEEAPYLILLTKVKVQAYNSNKWQNLIEKPQGDGDFINRDFFLNVEPK